MFILSGFSVFEIPTSIMVNTEPTLLLDEEICKANIKQMAEKTRQHGLRFKPHMKTHQSAEIGEWLKNEGAEAITVSSVTMAEYFSRHGWQDITIAFPCNIRQADQINTLAGNVELTLLGNSIKTVQKLTEELSNNVKVYIELDTGSDRTGLKLDQLSQIKALIKEIKDAQHLEWIGFYSHPGHSYGSKSEKEIRNIHKSVVSQIEKLRNKLTADFGKFEVCVGDTPCCSKAGNFEGIDAISPGNFVFYDLMQVQIGSCNISDIAVAVECPVVGCYPERNELAVYGGAVHFSKESLKIDKITHFGLVASWEEDQWTTIGNDCYLQALSQEHGLVKCPDQVFDRYQVGDFITVLPVHSCLTANLMGSYQLENGRIINQL